MVLATMFLGTMCARKLVFSTLVFRHGERQRYIPQSPNQKCWKHLINVGMRQQYINGLYYRSKFVRKTHLLPERFDPGTVYIRSTYLSRALTSAVSFYAGLYGPELFQPNLRQFARVKLPIESTVKETYAEYWTPRGPPIHTISKNEDELMYSYKKFVCPTIGPLKNQIWMSDKQKDLEETQGVKATRPPYEVVANNPNLIRLAGHNILNQIMDYIKLALFRRGLDVGAGEGELLGRITKRDPAFRAYLRRQGNNPQARDLRLLVYSSHDSLVVSLVNALGVYLDARVPVASTIEISVYIDQETGMPYVEALLNQKKLHLPDCHGICTVSQFMKAVKENGVFDSRREYLYKCHVADLTR